MDFLNARWENLVMANYAIDPKILLPYLPKGVELDFHEGKTYVSLVGFKFRNTRLFKLPIPFMGTFEEVNLRFYVKRIVGNEVRRGVVFINETVPYKIVATIANVLYKEHYTAIPTGNKYSRNGGTQQIEYSWKINNAWKNIILSTLTAKREMEAGSLEEFIFEHYYGYTKVDDGRSIEYKVDHPRWQTNIVQECSVFCDFGHMYGSDFAFLSNAQPDSIVFSEGSAVSVKWKRTSF